MSPKWCFSVLVVILALFGIQQGQVTIPNQEIVVQFTDVGITQEETESAISNVKAQLQFIGADNIQVQEASNGVLKISYYSDSDIASIKEVFSNSDSVKLGLISTNKKQDSDDVPYNRLPKTYNVDVYEIIDGSNTDWDLEGITVLEFKSETHRFFNPNIYASTEELDVKGRNDNNNLKVNTHIAVAINNRSYKIPETRAGPIC